MNVKSIEQVAALIGEAGRIQMLTALLDGQSHSAGDLALTAGISAQTASAHLSKLVAGGLLAVDCKGRQRLFRFKSPEVAVAVEALGALARRPKTRATPELCVARTCYDHLAGALSIALRDQMLRKGLLHQQGNHFFVFVDGECFLRDMGIDVAPLRGLRRSFARKCLDWTERDHHIGGAVGAAMLTGFLEKKWVARIHGTRAVRITHEGQQVFERVFSIRCSALRSQV